MGRILVTAVLAMTLAKAASAQSAEGLWASPPDPKGQTGIVQITPCGAALCGTLIKAFDPNGQPIVTPNVGKQLIWDMKAAGPGHYDGGRVYVPLFGRDYAATMQVSGTKLTVKGCAVGVCKSQHWQRAN
ncbi:DUF2147 domain-containing protein [Phaeobacter sp. J2-8]|uniref:DUF2147 domain-containing protein n=1 Tax=Phaeobacter sp. J2-8 TaxID=2931394 RepID=UPI001FD02C6D|nr:DUF2147 domain-containing protein [Phaeobacter sp. J2-8]MCJ7872651.1 DUF2147 domain-containing protein [Phaeobacter sp. J2-8]